MFTPYEASSMGAMIEAGKNLDVSHSKLYLKSSFVDKNGDTIIINFSSLIDRYYYFLQKIIFSKTLTDLEFETYRYQPKLLSNDMYGTTELWSAILRINNIPSITQFNKQTLNLFTGDIFDVINEIFILDSDRIKANDMAIYGK